MNKPSKTSWISPKVEFRSSKISGKGMFALEDIKEGEEVVIWGGNYVNRKQLDSIDITGKLVMQWDEDLYSVDERGDDDSYYINHSCDSNLWMTDAITLVAKKPIFKGEELTADYALWDADENYVSKWNCACGSPLCRSKVTGVDYKNKELQTRYKGHFSPLINKRISMLSLSSDRH